MSNSYCIYIYITMRLNIHNLPHNKIALICI